MCIHQLCHERNSGCLGFVRCGWDLAPGKACLVSLLRSVNHWRSASSGFLIQSTPLECLSPREQRGALQSRIEFDH